MRSLPMASEHITRAYDEELRRLGNTVAEMGGLAESQLGAAIEAVMTRDTELDEMYSSLFRELLTYMMEDPRSIGSCTHLLFMAKNIERIGDHATNIAENLYYLVNGTPLEEVRPKGDVSSLEVIMPDRAPQ